MNKHDHKVCEHEVEYCKHCDTCYCKICGKEWTFYTLHYNSGIYTTGTTPLITYHTNHT